MIDTPRPARAGPTERCLTVSASLRCALAFLLLLSVLLAFAAAQRAVGLDPDRPEIVDFHPFYLAGRMVWDGRFADAYDITAMQHLQRTLGGGRDVFIPFIYPPLFGLVIAPFALLPVAVAFLLFTVSSLAFYLVVMRRLAGEWFWTAILALSPVLLIDIRLGQNGFLTGALVGGSAALALGGRQGLAGMAAGALAFKPHLGAMLPVLFLMRRSWIGLATAALAGVALTGLSILVLGIDTVTGFLGSMPYVGRFMAAGAFPVHRMTSIYASGLSFGLPAWLALALHGIAACVVLAFTLETAARLRAEPDATAARTACGLLIMGTVFISPYLFDYDLTVFGIGLVLVLPRLSGVLSARALTILLVVLASIEASGIVLTLLVSVLPGATLSPAGPALLLCFAFMLLTLRRSAPGAAPPCIG